MQVNIPDLTNEECSDIAVTAIEGGISYWAQVRGYSPRTFIDLDTMENKPIADTFVYAEVMADDGSGEEIIRSITPNVIRRGFVIALDAARKDLVRAVLAIDREDWTGYIDADGADAIVQCGIFGEVRYA